MGIPITVRLKEIKKRRALIGKQRVVVLTNSFGLTNSSAYNPFLIMRNSWPTRPTQTFGILISFILVQDK